MAIVIKVKADTKELEKDIKDAATKAKAAVDSIGTGPGAAGLSKISDQFKRMRTEVESMRGRVEELKKSSVGLDQTLGSSIKTLGSSITLWFAYGSAIAFAKKHTIDMVRETAKLNDELLETSLKTGKTAEKMQQLVKGGRDLTGELRSLGAVLSYETIKKASEATDGFALLDKQLFAIQTRITGELSDALQGVGRSLAETMERIGPIVVRMARSVGNAIESMLPALETTLGILARINELQDKVGTPIGGKLGREALGFIERQFAAPPSRTDTLALGHTAAFTPSTELRDFLKSPITEQRLLEQRARDARARTRGGRAARGETLPTGSIDAIQILGRVLETLEENAIGAAQAIGAMNARTLDILAGRERQRRQLADVETITAEQAGLTTGIDDTRIRKSIHEFNQFVFDEQQKVFEEVRQQAVRFKEGIVYTFESAFREGFERGPKAFLQATAGAIKSFFSQIAAELSTGVIELILFGKGGASGQGIGRGGLLGGLSASAATGGGGGVLGGLLGRFGGFGGGTFGGSIFGGGGGGSIGVAPSLSGNLPILSSSGILNASGFGGLIPGGVGGGAAAGGIFGGVGGIAGIAGPALLGGLLGTGLGGKSLGGKILGGIGGGIAGIGVGIGAAVGLAGGGLLAGALAATGFGLLALPFIVGAVLLGKAKQRRSDEQAADAIWVEEREQIRQLIQAVNADRIDGPSALAQAQALRGATVQQLSQIKTKSVRESRLSNQLRDLDNTVIAELRAAVERQARRRSTGSFLVPEFASGGYVQGVDMGRDSVLARVRPGELVLTKQHQRSIQSRAGQYIFEEIGLPGYQRGGYVQQPASGATAQPFVIELHVDEGVMLGRIQSNDGQQVIVKTIRKARLNGDL